MDKNKSKNTNEKDSKKDHKPGGGRMAVSLREFPTVKGRDAERFLEEKKKIEELREKLSHNFKNDPPTRKVSRRSKGFYICKPK
ncbi:MAG: hypothetical protein FH756_08420 [Firmicutes bacterium]|nr:hypothetical protein [Bacillota bacterium]